MPYIDKSRRSRLDCGGLPSNDGELNYEIHKLIKEYWHDKIQNGSIGYNDIKDMVGTLHCVANEIWDRLGRPYEDEKRRVNGDVEPYKSMFQNNFPYTKGNSGIG